MKRAIMIISISLWVFLPRSEESGHEQSAQCMFYYFKYSKL